MPEGPGQVKLLVRQVDFCKVVTCLVNHIDGLVQEKRNSIANALELGLSCTNSLENIPENARISDSHGIC